MNVTYASICESNMCVSFCIPFAFDLLHPNFPGATQSWQGVEKHEDAVFIQGFEFPSLSLRQLLRYPEPEEGDILCDFGLGVCRIVSLSESAVSVPRGPRSFVTLRTLVFLFFFGGAKR